MICYLGNFNGLAFKSLNVAHFVKNRFTCEDVPEEKYKFLASCQLGSGIDTDVVPEEQLWQSYQQTFSTTASGNKITREQFPPNLAFCY